MDSAKCAAIYRRALDNIVEIAEINLRFDHVWAIAHGALVDAEDERYPHAARERKQKEICK